MIDKKNLAPVLVLLGPTGFGKTGASVLVAGHLGTEIISADSMQVYRYMDIGTAKPAPEQLAAVRHHMIDIVDPWEEFSSGRYIEQVVPIIDSLHKEGRIPLVVGGTGLYIKAMTRGLFEAPGADWPLREELLLIERESPGSLYERLELLDPVRADELVPTDLRRIVRALEVCIKSGQPMSGMHEDLTAPLPYDFIKVGLIRDRTELYRRIEERVDRMIEAGLIDEVRRFLGVNPCRTALQAIGYKEIAQYLRSGVDLENAVNNVKIASRRYAKRQITWFRKEEGIRWIDITGQHDEEEIVYLIMQRMETEKIATDFGS